MKHLFLSPGRNKVQLIRSEIVEGEVVGIGFVEGEIDFTYGDVEIVGCVLHCEPRHSADMQTAPGPGA
jgi:hypothetical protein